MRAILLEDLLENMQIRVEPFAMCRVSDGWRLRLPELDVVTMHFVIGGEGELRVGQHRERLGARTLAIVPGHRQHSLRTSAPSVHHVATAHEEPDGVTLREFVAGNPEQASLEVLCGHVNALYAGIDLFERLDVPVVLDFSGSDEMERTFDGLLAESRRRQPGSATMLRALMNECLVSVFRELCGSAECRLPWLLALEDPRMSAALRVVLNDPAGMHSVRSLADVATMSRSAFANEFTERFGQSPMAYVKTVRLRRAAELLQTTSMTITAVAHRVGYASRSHFSRAFTEAFGQSPTDFRRPRP